MILAVRKMSNIFFLSLASSSFLQPTDDIKNQTN